MSFATDPCYRCGGSLTGYARYVSGRGASHHSDECIKRLRAEVKFQTDNSANLQSSIDGLHGRIRELGAELTEARKPDCRFCVFRFPLKDTCAIDDCVDGSRYKAFGPAVLAPVRLYEKEGKV